jgi:hypothetical protein
MNLSNIKYILLNIALIAGSIMVFFFSLVGIDVVFKMNTVYGYIFMMLCGASITLCSCYAAINIKALKATK